MILASIKTTIPFITANSTSRPLLDSADHRTNIHSLPHPSAFSVLNADDLSAIQTGKKTIHLRLYHKHNRNDYEWIQAHDLQINRQPALVVRKKTRTAPVKQPFVIPPPIMISAANIKSRNRFSFNCPREFYGYLVVQLVSPRSIEEVRTMLLLEWKSSFKLTMPNWTDYG